VRAKRQLTVREGAQHLSKSVRAKRGTAGCNVGVFGALLRHQRWEQTLESLKRRKRNLLSWLYRAKTVKLPSC